MKCIRMMSVCGATCEVHIRIESFARGRRWASSRCANRIESNRIESNHAPPGPRRRPSAARAAAYSCVSNSRKDSVSAGFRRTPG